MSHGLTMVIPDITGRRRRKCTLDQCPVQSTHADAYITTVGHTWRTQSELHLTFRMSFIHMLSLYANIVHLNKYLITWLNRCTHYTRWKSLVQTSSLAREPNELWDSKSIIIVHENTEEDETISSSLMTHQDLDGTHRTGWLSIFTAETTGWNQRQQPGSASKISQEENNAWPSKIFIRLNILKHKFREKKKKKDKWCESLINSAQVNPTWAALIALSTHRTSFCCRGFFCPTRFTVLAWMGFSSLKHTRKAQSIP